MKRHLKSLLTEAVAALCRQGVLGDDSAADAIHIERTRNPKHGDFACNLAMVLAKASGENPRDLAGKIIAELPPSPSVTRAEIAGPGFINFFINDAAYRAALTEIHTAGAQFGNGDIGDGRRVLVEFVSANPTGPLHVGHGRGAAYGDAVARLLGASGYQVEREYYVNDAGRQMDILALSVWLRYLELCGEKFTQTFPPNAYLGGYVRELADDLYREHGDKFRADLSTLFNDLPEIKSQTTADEKRIKEINESRMDILIARAKTTLGDENYRAIFQHACDKMVAQIADDLAHFGVEFNAWFSEQSLLDSGEMKRAIATLKAAGHIYKKAAATWFRAQNFGDEKDRPVLRADGSHTYFAPDIAYHFNKGVRGFDLLLNVFGADHHGYATRIRAAFEALGHDPKRLQVRLVQFAVLYRDGEKIQMSTRAGEFVTLRELCDEVGVDAARFFYVSRKNDQHMDFDLSLARAQSADNPVYYIQYAHARICSVFRKLPAQKIAAPFDDGMPNYDLLTEKSELNLMKSLLRFPEVVEVSAENFEPHLLAYYLRELATEFHAYYNAHPFLASEDSLRRSRLGLVDAVRQVIANGLALLGVSAPQKM